MNNTITLLVTIICAVQGMAQIITFDDQGFANGQSIGNPYTITNNGEVFRFTITSSSATTQHRYQTTENSCTSTGLSHITAGTFSATAWTIETVSGNEIDLGTIRFDNVFQCFAFEYNLTIEGFKDNLSTGSQSFTTNGLNSIFTPNSSFDDVDKIVIISTDLGNLGIDDINWTASTLHNDEFVFEDNVKLDINKSLNVITIISNSQVELKKHVMYSISGVKIVSGRESIIDTSSLVSGIYVLKLNFNKGVMVKKVIIT